MQGYLTLTTRHSFGPQFPYMALVTAPLSKRLFSPVTRRGYLQVGMVQIQQVYPHQIASYRLVGSNVTAALEGKEKHGRG